MTDISNTADILDSRDIIERIEELTAELEGAVFDEENETWSLDGIDMTEEHRELSTLENLANEAEHYGDWKDGETLIHESYFIDYCKDLVSDIGDMPRDIPSYIVIDWEATADNLKADYITVDFDGETYLMRA